MLVLLQLLRLQLLLLDGWPKGRSGRRTHWCDAHRRQRPGCWGVLSYLLLFIVRIVEREFAPEIHL